jgi:2-polyprenyl-3-methyl-5-hydroxy-6-metoxy-1,4-benzoquinol methylase
MDESEYVHRLKGISDKKIKKFLKPFNPYRRNLRRLISGNCLEIGCGIGRNLSYLGNSANIGVDLNHSAVEYCKSIGHSAYTSKEFDALTEHRASFDNILLSHVLEHMEQPAAVDLIKHYLPALKPTGRIVIVCPQLRGFKSDPTHVEYMNFKKLSTIVARCGLGIEQQFSHPLHRAFGRLFIYNEFVIVATKK